MAQSVQAEVLVLKRERDRKLAQRADLQRVMAEVPTGGALHAKRTGDLRNRLEQIAREITRLQEKIRELENPP